MIINKLVLFFKGLLIAVTALLFVYAVLYLMGMRVNATPSLPVGIYWRIHKQATKGDIASFCPMDTPLFQEAKRRGWIGLGFCAGKYARLLKIVVAQAGDIVTINSQGVWINGVLKAHSQAIQALGLPQLNLEQYRLKQDELMMMANDNPLSFDSRYYGVIQRVQLRDTVIPIWVIHKRDIVKSLD